MLPTLGSKLPTLANPRWVVCSHPWLKTPHLGFAKVGSLPQKVQKVCSSMPESYREKWPVPGRVKWPVPDREKWPVPDREK